MTRPDDTATIERDLRAVDSALAAGTAAHDDPAARELQELALALRADAPEPDARFAAELRERVDAGFPRRPGATRRPAPLRGRMRSWLLPATAVAATVMVIALAVAMLKGPSDTDDAAVGDGGGAAESAAPPEAGQAQPGGEAAIAPGDRGGGFVPGQSNRKIERSFSLELEVPLEEMTRVADRVTTVTNRYGGFVLSSSVDTGEDGGGGDFSLRIPTDRLRPALRDLGALAPVVQQSQEGRDVTRQHVTAKDRLEAARAERRGLLRRLEQAETDEQAEAIRRRLDLVAGEIDGLRAQLRDLRLRTDYAVVSLSLLVAQGDSGDSDGSGGVGGSFDDAMGDAGGLLVGFAGILVRVLALAVPIGLIALAAGLAARGFRRRRRESALV